MSKSFKNILVMPIVEVELTIIGHQKRRIYGLLENIFEELHVKILKKKVTLSIEHNTSSYNVFIEFEL